MSGTDGNVRGDGLTSWVHIVAAALMCLVVLVISLLAAGSGDEEVTEDPYPTHVPGTVGERVGVMAGLDDTDAVPVALHNIGVTRRGDAVIAAVRTDTCHGLVRFEAEEDAYPSMVLLDARQAPIGADDGRPCRPVTWEISVVLGREIGDREIVDLNARVANTDGNETVEAVSGDG